MCIAAALFHVSLYGRLQGVLMSDTGFSSFTAGARGAQVDRYFFAPPPLDWITASTAPPFDFMSG